MLRNKQFQTFYYFFIDVGQDVLPVFHLFLYHVPLCFLSSAAALLSAFLLGLAGSHVFNEPIRDSSTNIPSH